MKRTVEQRPQRVFSLKPVASRSLLDFFLPRQFFFYFPAVKPIVKLTAKTPFYRGECCLAYSALVWEFCRPPNTLVPSLLLGISPSQRRAAHRSTLSATPPRFLPCISLLPYIAVNFLEFGSLAGKISPQSSGGLWITRPFVDNFVDNSSFRRNVS